MASCTSYTIRPVIIHVELQRPEDASGAMLMINDYLISTGFVSLGTNDEVLKLMRDTKLDGGVQDILSQTIDYTKDAKKLRISVVNYSDTKLKAQWTSSYESSVITDGPSLQINIYYDSPDEFSKEAFEFYVEFLSHLKAKHDDEILVIRAPNAEIK